MSHEQDSSAAEQQVVVPDPHQLSSCPVSAGYQQGQPVEQPRTDVDYPETIDLRSRISPDRGGYRMIGSSVTDLDWMSELPTGRLAFVVAEGLTMYLDPMGGPALLSALWITEHFPALRRMGQVFHLSFGPSAALPRLKPR